MIIAIILAGGSGSRIGQEIPKQFIEINGKPILVHTLERFEQHPDIEKYVVVCREGWESVVEDFRPKFGLGKMATIATGGETALQSIRNGVEAANCGEDDILVVHEGVRPLVDTAALDNVINDCKTYGGAISAVPLVEHIAFEGDERTDLRYIPRERAFRTITPQAYKYERVKRAFDILDKTGNGANSSFIGTLMMDIGETVVLSKGSERNIKITDPKDLLYFKMLIG